MFRFAKKNESRTIRRHVLACLFCLLLIAGSAASVFAANYTTESFHTTLDIQQNSSMHVTETIQVTFQEPSHGIYRDIWMLGKNWFVEDDELIESEMLYKLKNFKCGDEKVSVSGQDDYKSVRIGSADVTITGPHTYVLEYDVVMYKDDIPQFDQLYWNVMPMYWESGADAFSFTVHMPSAVDMDLEVITGPLASGDTSRGVWTMEGTTIEGYVEGPIEYGDGVTLRAKLPEGYWKGAKNDTPWFYAVMTLIGLLTFYVITLFFRYGKDRRPVKTVEFYPPDDMSSAELGYLYDAKLQDKDMVSMVMWFASKGYLRILVSERDEKSRGKKGKYKITLQKLADLPEDAPQFQKTLFKGLFPKTKEKAVLDQLPSSFGGRLESSRQELIEQMKPLMTDPKSEDSRRTGCLIGIGIFFLVLLSFFLFLVTDDLYSSLLGELVLSTLFILICVKFMLRPSDYRWAMQGRIKGFREFIKKAELDRIEKLVEEDPEYFYKILPYAYVFGLTDKWAKNFEALAAAPPEWYSGDMVFFRDPGYFTRAVTQETTRSFHEAMPKPSYSSFSGGGGSSSGGGGFSSSSGGGFSGGGGGGGGGGSW